MPPKSQQRIPKYMEYEISVSSAFGVEGITKRELIAIGMEQKGAINGRFDFFGTALDIARCNMFLRTAERVYIKVGGFTALTFDDLFEGVKELPWERYLSTKGKYIVNGRSVNSQLFAISSCQSIIKKAIIERMKQRTNTLVFPETGEDYNISFAIHKDEAVLYIDTSGKGLHKRGYRDFVAEAPIRETLAAALVMLSDFDYEEQFIDPFCGSGTLVIEGARQALNIASGEGREFDFSKWEKFDTDTHFLALEEARDLERRDRNVNIKGFDIDKKAVSLALRHAERAGVGDRVHIQVQDVRDLTSRFSDGVIVTNPPFGERLLSEKEVYELYSVLGDIYNKLDNWSLFAITSASEFERYFGKKADRTRKFFSSQIECRYYQYFKEKRQRNRRG